MAEGVIYKYTSPSGKVYIGQTLHKKTRINEHKCMAFKGSKSPFHRAIVKYGLKSFTSEIIETIVGDPSYVKSKLNELEEYYIEKLNTRVPNGYNVAVGGDSKAGYTVSEETKKLISLANKGHITTEETKEKIRQANLGQKRGKETREKISRAAIGRKVSEETKLKLSKIHKGKKFSTEHKEKIKQALLGRPCTWKDKIALSKCNKKVLQYKKDGTFITEYSSVTSASDNTGISMTNLYKCLSGKNHTAGGFMWKYKEN